MASERPVRIFYSYSHTDEEILARLRTHLTILRRGGRITEWFDRDIEAGREWREEIARELNAADLILLLVSSDFLDSDFCYEQEMARAMERSDRGEALVIAVMLRPVDGWAETPFSKLQVVPRDALPVTRWKDQDEALVDVASKIRRAVERLGERETPLISAERSIAESRLDVSSPSVRARMREVVAGLEDLIAQPVGEYLIISADDERNYYTQYRTDEKGLWCEAVSNQWLEPEHALEPQQISRLAELGWKAPEENLPNWWWAAPEDTSLEAVATLTLETLTSVYGAQPAKELGLKRSW
jgi:hypothetical protein